MLNKNKTRDQFEFDLHPALLLNVSVINQQILQNVNQSWQTLANPASTVDYSSHLLSATLPISIQHFLKYSETIKKETVVGSTVNSGNLNLSQMDTTGGGSFNIKSDLLNLKNGVGNNLNLALGGSVSNNMTGSGLNHVLEPTTHVAEATTTTGKKKKKKPPKIKVISFFSL